MADTITKTPEIVIKPLLQRVSSKRPQQAKTSKPPSISSNRKIFPVETLCLTRQQVKIFKAKTGKPLSLGETAECCRKKSETLINNKKQLNKQLYKYYKEQSKSLVGLSSH